MKPLFITGAGLSAPSGIPTYRQDENSLYNDEALMAIMHIDSLYDPVRLTKLQAHFADWQALIDSKAPNRAHTLIKDIVEAYDGFVVTQNVDNYLERAGLDEHRIYHIHGDFSHNKPNINVANVVLFGEMLIDEPAYLSQHLSEFDTIVIAGTSLTVTSVFPYIRPYTDVYIVNKEAVELPIPVGFFKSVNYIGGDIIDGLAQLQQIFADKMS